jgi:peptidoglycan/xylan/chitin deacetylase (PgdA/CDA1 family)
MINKRKFAALISGLIHRIGLLDAYSFIRHRFASHRGVILLYHRVDAPDRYPWGYPPVSSQEFEKEIKYLRKNYNVIPLDRLVQYLQRDECFPPRTAALTLDDGYKDHYLNAYRILKKYSCPATIFLATDRIDADDLFWSCKVRFSVWKTAQEMLELDKLGTYFLKTAIQRKRATSEIIEKLRVLPCDEKNTWIEQLMRKLRVAVPKGICQKYNLTWDEVREMSKNGITFGSHSVTHPKLSALSLEDAKREIVESKTRIEEELDTAVTTFAYPLGRPSDFNDNIVKALKESGFTCSVTGLPQNMVERGVDLYRLPRISPGSNAEIFKLLISELYFDLKAGLRRIRGSEYET